MAVAGAWRLAGRVTSLAALEALLLALPAAVCAPLLAGPLTRLLSGWGALSRIGLRLDTSVTAGGVWLVGRRSRWAARSP